MSNPRSYAEHREIVCKAALVWTLEHLHGTYDSFLEMLLTETEDRHVLPSFFVLTLTGKTHDEETLSELCIFLHRALEHDVLFKHYVKETRMELKNYCPGSNDIHEVFEIYDALGELDAGQRTEEKIAEITKDSVHGGWFERW
jgi:hypothetical protein